MVLNSLDETKEVLFEARKKVVEPKGRYLRVSWEGEREFHKKQKLNGLVRVTVIQLISIELLTEEKTRTSTY